ncbi:DUF4194 domain-containing protein [Luteococcus sediminum]
MSEPRTNDDDQLARHQLGSRDRGRLADDTRRAIIALVRGPYLSAARQPELWRALLRDRAAIELHLGNMFLEMVVDLERQLAFVHNAELEVETPRVVRQLRLGLLDTALLLDLRQRLLHDVDVSGRVFVDRAELEEALAAYRPQASTNLAGFARAVTAAIEKMRKAAVLLLTSQPERFEISPVLAVAFDADELAAVARDLAELRDRGDGGLDLSAEPDEADENDDTDEELQG